MKKFLRGLQRRGRGDQVALLQADGLVGRCGVGEEAIHAEGLGVGHRMGLRIHRPPGTVVGGRLIWLRQPRFLVFPADPPCEAATLIADGERGRGEMNLQFLASGAAADRVVTQEDRLGSSFSGVWQDAGVSRDQPGKEPLLLFRGVASRGNRPALGTPGQLMIGALPALPNPEDRRIIGIEDIRLGRDPGVGSGLLLEVANGEHERQPGIGPSDGAIRPAAGRAKADRTQGQQAQGDDREQHHQRDGDDEGESSIATGGYPNGFHDTGG